MEESKIKEAYNAKNVREFYKNKNEEIVGRTVGIMNEGNESCLEEKRVMEVWRLA